MLSRFCWFSPVDLLTSWKPQCSALCALSPDIFLSVCNCLPLMVLAPFLPPLLLSSASPDAQNMCSCLMGYSSLLILPNLHVKYISSIIRLLELLFIYFFFFWKTCLNCSPGCVWIRGKQSAWVSPQNAGIRWVRYHIQLKPFPFSYKMLAVSQMAANMVFFSLLQHVQ